MVAKKQIQDRRYTVIRDTREQTGWEFPSSSTCVGTIDQKMVTGDYTLVGYENILSVERKANTAEIAANVFEKRFTNELQRLEEFKFSFIVCEFTLADVINFPLNSSIPQKRWCYLKVTPQLLMKKINELQIEFKTKWIFAGCYGREFTSSLFKRVIENVQENKSYFG